jgi:hypothetical protein
MNDLNQRNVYIASLPRSFTDDELCGLCSPYGAVESSRIFNQAAPGGGDALGDEGRTYGFVVFCDGRSAQLAIEALAGHVLAGQRIQVRFAKQSTTAAPRAPRVRQQMPPPPVAHALPPVAAGAVPYAAPPMMHYGAPFAPPYGAPPPPGVPLAYAPVGHHPGYPPAFAPLPPVAMPPHMYAAQPCPAYPGAPVDMRFHAAAAPLVAAAALPYGPASPMPFFGHPQPAGVGR